MIDNADAALIRHDRTRAEVAAIYNEPLLNLVFRAQELHRQFHAPGEVQLCRLLSVKTGGCPEDCGYCPQSARYGTAVEATALMPVDDVLREAEKARSEGATRFCMGAAWREARDGKDFDRVLEMVRGVAALGMEACCTLGMIGARQARQLADAGLTAYNHNLDTSPEYYGKIITTRHYEDRLRTLDHVRAAGITVCCGGIIGMGESAEDRAGLLHQLARLDPHPESVPINMLVRVEGTPLARAESADPLDPLELVRTIAAARILMPASRVRLSAGRRSLSREATALCFLAGANSIFTGEKLLTTPNPGQDEDERMLRDLGLHAQALEA